MSSSAISFKQVARVGVMLGMLCSIGLIIAGNVVGPLFTTSTPRATYATWTNCLTAGGAYACYTKFSTPAANAECSELDDRTTTVGVMSVIWAVAAAHTIGAMIWEAAGRTQPISNMSTLLFLWTGGIGTGLAVLLVQTLVAQLCNNPLTFTDASGAMGIGGILICSAAAASVIPFVVYFVSPSEESVSTAVKKRPPPKARSSTAQERGAGAGDEDEGMVRPTL